MKRLLHILLFLIPITIFSQPYITVDETTFTNEQLVTDVLIGNTCAAVGNITSSTGTDFGSLNGIGYFENTNPNFPISDGIIMMTGNVMEAPGPNGSPQAGGGWPGDAQIENYLNTIIPPSTYLDASILEFDFTPVTDSISFNFVFASNEYGTFQCDYSDAFAFFLEDIDTGVVTNLALVPDTPGEVPISVTTIRDQAHNGSCASSNPEYFSTYYGATGLPNVQAPINFNGHTVLMQAWSYVVPNANYRMKLVIVDRLDSSFNSAVFIQGGSFFLGSIDLGVDLTIANGTARCLGETYTIDTQLGTVPPGTTFLWEYEDPLGSGIFVPFVPSEESSILNVTNTGNYRVTVNFAGVCESQGEIFVEFDLPFTVNDTPSPLILCDDNNNGFALFTLSDADDDITLGDPDLTVTYHGTELNAINNVDPIGPTYENDNPYFDVVWARVESAVSSCYSVVALNLEVRNTPEIVEPEPLRLCDDNNPGDGVEVFDLTVVEPEVLNGLDPTHYDFYYYVNEADAIAAGDSVLLAPPGDFTAAIANPGAYQNQIPNNQTIYILVVGNDLSVDPGTVPPSTGESCYSIVELELIVDPLPVANLPAPYELCDDAASGSTTDEISTFDLTSRNDEITGGVADVTVTWYLTPADELADIEIPTPESFQNTITPQTVVARVTDLLGCSSTTTLTLVVLPNPTPTLNPTPLEACDNGDDLGIADFDLSLRDAEIMNGEMNVAVTYYIDIPTAEAGVPGTELAIPYTNEVPFLQTIYARVTRVITPPSTAPACYTIVPLDLIVLPLPDVPTADFGDLFSCDTDGDGTAEFDLTINTPFVIGTQDPGDLTGPTYHTSEADAQTGDAPIVNTTEYISAGGETIWVRLEFTATGCTRISSFDLIVGEFPIILSVQPMRLCDDQESGSTTDGISIFDLTLNDDAITGGNPDYEVFYYETEAAQDANDPIPNPESYANIDSPIQILFVSVFSTSEGCEARTTLTIEVLPLPAATDFETDGLDYDLCDDSPDGFALFDLSTQTPIIENGDTDVNVSYHETLLDAQDGVFALDPVVLYENLVPFSQTLWVRVEREALPPPNTDPRCFVIIELRLNVLPTPEVPLALDPIVLCDEGNTSEFDLTIYEELIYGTQNPDDYAITYHLSEADSETGDNPIVNPEAYTNTSNPQTIWVRLTDTTNDCYATVSFEIEVTPGPVAIQPTPLDACDDLGEPYDGITIFDLTDKNDEITGGVAGVEVRYYETEEDAQQDENRINPETAYEGENLQLLYVRVVDGNTGCVSFTTLLLRVYSNPLVGEPDPLELCDDNDPGDGFEEFDLVDAQAQILNGGDWEVLYYETLEAALLGDELEAIGPLGATEVLYTNTTPFEQIIYVRVTNQNQVQRCFEIVELTLIVNPLPDDSADIDAIIACEIGTDGEAVFDLTEREEQILNGQDPTLFTVTYYRSELEAQTNTNPIVNTTTFANTSNPQTIYTGILNTETDCYVGGVQSFELLVQEGVLITQPAEPLIACENVDDNGIGTGEGTFDLTELDEEILTGQDPTEYDLSYHESLEDAQEGLNAIPNTTNYTSPTATIWARVSYSDPNPDLPPDAEDCFEVVEISLLVETAPIFDPLQDSYRLCVDEFGNPIVEEFGSTSPPVIDTGLSTPQYIFIWEIDGQIQFDLTQGSITATQGGVYTVTIIDATTGCETQASTTVTVSSPPLVFNAQAATSAFAGEHAIEASAEGLGDYIFRLDDGPFQDEGFWDNVEPGTHIVTITDRNGCGTVEIEVGVIDYPFFFTPNEDGYHDTWNIIGIGSIPDAKIYIFDRHGKLLKQISPTGAGWDGTYNGRPLPSSDYWFRVVYREDDREKEFRAHFTLKR